MKLKNLSAENINQLVPRWMINPIVLARHVDDMLTELYASRKDMRPRHWEDTLRFWVDATQLPNGEFMVRAVEQEGEQDKLFLGQLVITAGRHTLSVALNDVLKGAIGLSGLHLLYSHTINCDVPLTYFGITKRRWFDRWQQHLSSASSGSPYVFHSALREHAEQKIIHRVIISGVSQEAAYHYEEQFVDEFSLYPMGLNMIPGGAAGIRYLHKLGLLARSSQERDEQVERLAARADIAGNPNPLCAARWASDQDYVNRVICGRAGRLSVDQVLTIRRLASFGKTPERVANMVCAPVAKVSGVLSGKVYGRVQ